MYVLSAVHVWCLCRGGVSRGGAGVVCPTVVMMVYVLWWC